MQFWDDGPLPKHPQPPKWLCVLTVVVWWWLLLTT